MKRPLIEQNKSYALGNFIMLTPTIKKLSEIRGEKIDVYFTTPYVKECFIDCEFMNHVGKLRREPTMSSSMVNRNTPDYKYVFENVINQPWTEKYHTYVDNVSEIPKNNEDYILLLNGLGGLSMNDKDPKPHWFGKKEISEIIFYQIKEKSKLIYK